MKKLSVLLYVDTDKRNETERCINSIFETLGLKTEQIQLIWLNAVAKEVYQLYLDELQKKYSKSIEFLDVCGLEGPQAYNRGITLCKGEYLLFLNNSCWLSAHAGKLLNDQKENLISIQPYYRGNEGENRIYKVSPYENGHKNAQQNCMDIQLMLQAYLIRNEFLNDLYFAEELHEEAYVHMVLRLLEKNSGCFFYEDQYACYYEEPLEDDQEFCPLFEKKWWYQDSLSNFLIPFMQEMKKKYSKKIPVYLQMATYYLLCVKYKVNLSGKDKQLLDQEEVQQFYETTCELLTLIDNSIIYQNDDLVKCKLPRALRTCFLRGKAKKLGMEIVTADTEGRITCSYLQNGELLNESEVQIGDLNNEVLNIRIINYQKGMLEIGGFFQGAAFLEEGSFRINGKISGEENQCISADTNDVYSLLKCFGITYAKKYPVQFWIPVDQLLKKGISFYVNYGERDYLLKLKFTSMSSRLLTNSRRAYWRFEQDRYILSRWNQQLRVEKYNRRNILKHEIFLNLVLLKQKPHLEAFTCVFMRNWYWITRPFYRKKRIWLTFDKLYKGGDNGEYFFQYCQNEQKEVDCYYVINKDASDRKRLKQQHGRRVIYANTWKCRLMALRAEAIMATHAGTAAYLGFPVKLHKYFKDLFQADNICIQHGLSIQKIANFQNRWYANTKLYCLASPFERNNVAHPIYGYTSEMLRMTGLARYDGLKNNEQRQILITPTWRKNIVHTKGVGMTNNHNHHFKETAYFRIYNSLINDETFISCAKENNYKIVFLLHPAMSAQMEDYDKNDYVKLLQATGDMSYEKILTESSLMVTDYSGVQFDFAYQRKPLLYYHPDELPPHYTEGGLIYSTMGFGPICTTHKQIIENLCHYMKTGCHMEEEYKKRADVFFAFDDYDNAKRIYEEVLAFENEH